MPLLMLGTRNRKKREEIVEILGDLPIEFGDLRDQPDIPEVEETGTTFEANARLKAEAVARCQRRLDARRGQRLGCSGAQRSAGSVLRTLCRYARRRCGE